MSSVGVPTLVEPLPSKFSGGRRPLAIAGAPKVFARPSVTRRHRRTDSTHKQRKGCLVWVQNATSCGLYPSVGLWPWVGLYMPLLEVEWGLPRQPHRTGCTSRLQSLWAPTRVRTARLQLRIDQLHQPGSDRLNSVAVHGCHFLTPLRQRRRRLVGGAACWVAVVAAAVGWSSCSCC